MSALGRLVASVVLDASEFVGGTDKAKQSAAQLATDVDRQFSNLQRNIGGYMTGIAAALAAGFGVNAMKEAFDSYTKGAAGLVDLAAKAGTTVEKMSQLSPIAKISGTSMDELTAAMEKLSKGVVNSNKETAGAEKALNFLGVSAKDANGKLKDSATLTEEIALKMATFADGMGKTTMAQDLFGKSGANLLPFLKDLGEYGVKDAAITTRQAELAKEYEQDLVRLGIAKGALGKIISKELLPVGDALVKTFLEMTTKSGGLRDEAKKLADDGSIRDFAMAAVRAIGLVMNAADSVTRIFDVVGQAVGSVLARVGNALGAIGSAMIDFIRGDYSKAWDDVKQAAIRDGAIIQDSGAKMRATLEKPLAGDAFVNTVQTKLNEIDAALNRNAASGKKSADGYKDASGGAKAAADAVDGLAASLGRQDAKLQAELDSLQRFGVSTKETTVAQVAYQLTEGNVAKALADRTKYTQDQADAMKAKILLTAEDIDKTNTLIDVEKKYLEAEKATRLAMGDSVQKLVEQIDAEKDKIATYGMSSQAMTQYAIDQLEVKKALAEATEGADLNVKALQLQIDKLKQLAGLQGSYQDMTDQVKVWDQLSSKAGEFFGNLVVNGKGAFDSLRSSLKSFAQEVIAFFAQRFVLQMAAGVGLSGASAAANAAGTSATGSLLSGAAGMVGTGLEMAGLGGGFMAAAGAGFSAGISTLGIAASAGAGAVGGFASVVGAAIPVIGWIVAAGALIYSVFGSKGGGPKDGGSFNEIFSSTGANLGAAGSRFFTPNGQDAALATSGRTTAASYFAALRALGGTVNGNVQFGLGFDTDPNGTAPNRVSSGVSVNGQSVFSSRDRDIGRDSANIGPQLQLEASRMILAALKASDLPDYLSHVFDGITVSTATQAEIDAALQQAAALKQIFDVIGRNPMTDAAAAMADAMNPFQAAVRNNQTAIQAAISSYDRSAASTQNLASATASYYNAQLQLITGIQQAKVAIDDMFGATMRNIQLAGLDKQGKYNFFQQDAQASLAQALSSNDPETVRRLASVINSDISSAFALLSPEEQAAQSPAFLARAGATQQAIDSHLDDVARTTASQTTEMMKRLEELLKANADKQGEAATAILQGGHEILEAARTPQQIQIRLDLAGQRVTNGG